MKKIIFVLLLMMMAACSHTENTKNVEESVEVTIETSYPGDYYVAMTNIHDGETNAYSVYAKGHNVWGEEELSMHLGELDQLTIISYKIILLGADMGDLTIDLKMGDEILSSVTAEQGKTLVTLKYQL